MHRYVKGARSERELLGIFHSKGYSVMRSAGSGVNAIAPDIIAIKDGLCMAFECKAWEKNRLSIDTEGFAKLILWESNTKFPTYVAWRMNGKGWFFIRLDEFKESGSDFSITRKRALEINRLLDSIWMHSKLLPREEEPSLQIETSKKNERITN